MMKSPSPLLTRLSIAFLLILFAACWALLNPLASLAVGAQTFPAARHQAPPQNLRFLGRYSSGGSAALSVALQNGYAFVGFSPTFTIVDVSNAGNPYSVGSINLFTEILGILLEGNLAYLANGDGLRIVNISNISSPQLVTTNYPYGGWVEDVTTCPYASFHCISDNTNGLMRIINTSSLPDLTQTGSANVSSPKGLANVNQYIYVAGSGGLTIVDADVPSNPVVHGPYSQTLSDPQDVVVVGSYAYVADGAAGLKIVNISNPDQMNGVGYCDTPGFARRLAISGSYAIVADAGGDVRVIDISNPSAPYETGFYTTNIADALDVAVVGSRVYVADSGGDLEILELYEPTPTPTRTGTSTSTYTNTPVPTHTFTPTQTWTPSNTPTSTDTLDPAHSPTPTNTVDPLKSPTPTPTLDPSTPATPTATSTIRVVGTPMPVYLPLGLQNYVSYFEGPWEVEPNNDYLNANGPLLFNQDYFAYPNDAKDYFSFYLPEPGKLTIDVNAFTGHGAQLLLYYQVPVAGGEVERDYDLPYHIEHPASAGWYYLYVYASGNYSSDSYKLRAAYAPTLASNPLLGSNGARHEAPPTGAFLAPTRP